MKASGETHSIHQDPLGLQELPLLEPETDGWPAIQKALQSSHARSRKWRSATGWLAVAASVVLAVVLGTRQTGPVETMPQRIATESPTLASTQSTQTVDSLI